jgi:uncharacterized RDD family membrane protein YckC
MTENTADGSSRPGAEGDQPADRRPPRREPPLAAAARQLAAERSAQKAAGVPVSPPPPTAPPPPPATPAPAPPTPAPAYAYYPPPAAPAVAGSPDQVLMDPVYSPWWKRVCAALIDFVTLSIPNGIVSSLLGGSVVETDPVTGVVTFDPTAGYVIAFIISILLSFGYYVLMEGGRTAATVGKMAMHITVRDASTWEPIGYGRALGRRLLGMALWWLFLVPGLLDVLSPLWDDRRQTWHDKAVNSAVVDKA